MINQKNGLNRRQLLQGTGVLAAHAASPVWAQAGKDRNQHPPLTVAQVVDVSPAQQDVSRDFLVGSRAAWQVINSRGGIRGRQIQHLTLQTDGTLASLRNTMARIKDDMACVALFGSVGDATATQVVDYLQNQQIHLAHAAPWLQNASLDIASQTFPIFAARQEQIVYALKTLSAIGLQSLGVVYASERDYQASHQELERLAASMQVTLHTFRGDNKLRTLGQSMLADTPSILLFMGGTPELAEFTQGLEKQSRQRYVVALADVNLQSLLEMGAARNTPVIATQAVPRVNAGLPVVRAYREALGRLFDEPPTALSLAGYIAATYTHEVLAGIDGALTRQTVLSAFQQRKSADIGGFRVDFNTQGRSSRYVTQSMMTADGRMIG